MNRELNVEDVALIDLLRGLAVEMEIPPGWNHSERQVVAVSKMDDVVYRVLCSCVVETPPDKPCLRIVASESQLDRAAREFFRTREGREKSA